MPRTTRSTSRGDKNEAVTDKAEDSTPDPSPKTPRKTRKSLPDSSPVQSRSSKRLKTGETASPENESVVPAKKTKIEAKSPAPKSTPKVSKAKRATMDSPPIATSPTVEPPKKRAPSGTANNTSKAQKRSRKSEPTAPPSSDAEEEDNQKKRVRAESPPSLISLRAPLPRKPSRIELYNDALKNLASRLDMFDLTDPSEATNLWCDWPTSDGPPANSKDLEFLLLNRKWFSGNGHGNSVCLSNGGMNGCPDGRSSSNNKGIDVISYCLAHMHSLKGDDFLAQKKLLSRELETYEADVFCFQNVNQECHGMLRDLLATRSCAFSQSIGSNLVAFSKTRFQLLTEHTVSGMDFARQLVKDSAYPAPWRRSLIKALSEGVSNEMLVTVLRHQASGQLLLVASHTGPSARPDITALNVTGALWHLARIWHEQTFISTSNGNSSSTNGNGHVINGMATKTRLSPRWLLCGPFNAGERSPIYQLARDGYPDDNTLDRLRCLKTVQIPSQLSLHLPPIDPEEEDHESDDNCEPMSELFTSKALIDLLWNAFQHPCTDATSCYQSVVGREPPFTRIGGSSNKVGAAMDYIWCSGSTLQTQTVLLPPCRALAALSPSSVNGKKTTLKSSEEPNNKAANNMEMMMPSIPLLARMQLVSTAS